MAEVKNTRKKPVAKKAAQTNTDKTTEELEKTAPDTATTAEQSTEQAVTKKPAGKKSPKQQSKTTISEQQEHVALADEAFENAAPQEETTAALAQENVEQPIATDEQKTDEPVAVEALQAKSKQSVTSSEKPGKALGKKFALSKNMIIILSCVLALVIIGVILAVCLTSCKSDDGQSKKYTVTFMVDGSVMTTYKLSAGETISEPKDIPDKDMHIFAGWEWENPNNPNQTQMFEFGTKISQNITLVAKFRGKTWVKVEFDPNGGEFEESNKLESLVSTDDKINEPTDKPTRLGYVFGGWFTEEECYNKFTFGSYPVENLTLYAGWSRDIENFVYVSYYGNGELLRVDPVRKEENVVLPDLFSDNSDMVVGDWMIDNNPNRIYTAGKATADLDLYVNYYTDGLEFVDIRNTATVTGYNGTATEVIVPSMYKGKTVTGISSYAFYRTGELSAVTSVKLPDTVVTIGEGAFYDCQYLASINLTYNVISIGADAFYRNIRLRNVGDISSVNNLGAGAFNGCRELREITLGNTLTEIGDYTFNDCASLTKVQLSDALTEIGEYAFSGCTALTSVDLESWVLVTIADNAFSDCSSLREINIAKPSEAVSMQGNPFANSRSVTIYVPSALLEEYQNNTNNTQFKDKFAAR